MSILGVIVRVPPARLTVIVARLQALPGVELALNPGDGRLVVVIEDAASAEPMAEGCAAPAASRPAEPAAATLAHIASWPEVLSTSLVYEYSGPDAPPPSGMPEVDGRSWREGLAATRRAAALHPP